MLKKVAAILAAILAATAVLVLSPPAKAVADPCTGSTWTIGIGGLKLGLTTGSWEDSSYIYADTLVGYDSINPVAGMNELNRLFWNHRNQCPQDYILIVGHSEGAGIAHAWVSAHKQVPNYSAVLIADPKRSAGPGGPGLASIPGSFLVGYPLAGVDHDFGQVPVLEVCNRDDMVCGVSVRGIVGYEFGGAHQRYDFNASDYPDEVSGVWYR